LEGLGPALSTFAFLTGVGFLIVATFGHASTVGLVLLPAVAGLTGVASLVGLTPVESPVDFRGGWFTLHIVAAMAGFAGFAVAAAAGLMYLLQFKELKSKHFGAIFRFFPPLDTLDRLGRRGILIGFPCLTLSVLLGWAWVFSYGEVGSLIPKLVWVLLSWLIFLAAILARAIGSRRAERGATVSAFGFVLVVLAYLIVRTQIPGSTFL
jgi:HemX protein